MLVPMIRINIHRIIIDKLLNLKIIIQSELPTCRITISTPTYRYDVKCSLTVKHIFELLKSLDIDIMNNSNITGEHLGKRGLHLKCKRDWKISSEYHFTQEVPLA